MTHKFFANKFLIAQKDGSNKKSPKREAYEHPILEEPVPNA